MFKNISLLIKITWSLNRDHSFADLKIFEVLRLSSPLWETATRKKREREESNYWSRELVSSWKSQRFLDSPKESNAPVRYIRDRCTHVTFIDFYARSRGKDVRPLIETSLSLTQRLVRRTRTRRKKKKRKRFAAATWHGEFETRLPARVSVCFTYVCAFALYIPCLTLLLPMSSITEAHFFFIYKYANVVLETLDTVVSAFMDAFWVTILSHFSNFRIEQIRGR